MNFASTLEQLVEITFMDLLATDHPDCVVETSANRVVFVEKWMSDGFRAAASTSVFDGWMVSCDLHVCLPCTSWP